MTLNRKMAEANKKGQLLTDALHTRVHEKLKLVHIPIKKG